MTTIHLPAGQGRPSPMTDGVHVAKAAVDDEEGAFEVFEVIASAGPTAPPHVSPWSGVMDLLEGHVTAFVDDTSYAAEPGDVVVFPARTPATFTVVGDSARLLAVTSGTRAGRFFADFADSVPLDQPLEASIDAIMSVTRRHGVTLAEA